MSDPTEVRDALDDLRHMTRTIHSKELRDRFDLIENYLRDDAIKAQPASAAQPIHVPQCVIELVEREHQRAIDDGEAEEQGTWHQVLDELEAKPASVLKALSEYGAHWLLIYGGSEPYDGVKLNELFNAVLMAAGSSSRKPASDDQSVIDMRSHIQQPKEASAAQPVSSDDVTQLREWAGVSPMREKYWSTDVATITRLIGAAVAACNKHLDRDDTDKLREEMGRILAASAAQPVDPFDENKVRDAIYAGDEDAHAALDRILAAAQGKSQPDNEWEEVAQEAIRQMKRGEGNGRVIREALEQIELQTVEPRCAEIAHNALATLNAPPAPQPAVDQAANTVLQFVRANEQRLFAAEALQALNTLTAEIQRLRDGR
jgi:hypothetical protein